MGRFTEFINTASEEMAKELVSPQAIFYVPGREKPLRGPGGYLEIIQMLRSGFPDIQWALEEVIVEATASPLDSRCEELTSAPSTGCRPPVRRSRYRR